MYVNILYIYIHISYIYIYIHNDTHIFAYTYGQSVRIMIPTLGLGHVGNPFLLEQNEAMCFSKAKIAEKIRELHKESWKVAYHNLQY